MAKSKDDDDDDKPVAVEAPEGAAGAGEGEGKKFSAKKIILFVILLLFLLGGGGAAAYFTGMLDKFLKKEEHVEGEEEAGDHAEAGHGDDHAAKKDEGHGEKKAAKKKGGDGGGHGGGHGEADMGGPAFLEIPNMLINLSGQDEQPRYLRLKVQLELEDQADLAAVQAVMPRVVDQFQTYLRELRIKDLRGSAGIYRLQMELLSRVNAAAAPTEVKDVLFQEILIQ